MYDYAAYSKLGKVTKPTLTNRDVAIYLIGSYICAAMLFGGLGIVLSSWRVAIGGAMIAGTLLAGLVLSKGA